MKVNNIYGGYDSVVVLHGVSIEVPDGEISGVIGPNNSGKSTLFNIMSGLLEPTSGEISLSGEMLTHHTTLEKVERGIILVPERRRLFPDMRVVDNLLLGGYSSRARSQRQASLEFVFKLFPILENRQKQLAKTLSGGEQQMLAIGRGLMSKPEVLLLDEPFLGLAPIVINEIRSHLMTLAQQGMSVLLAEQNTVAALRTATSTVYVISHGRVVHQGKSEDLINDDKVEKVYLGKL